MTWREYQAYRLTAPNRLPTVNDLVEKCLERSKTALKREEIASMVASETGISFDEVKENISHTLSYLSKHGLAHSPTRGYWAHT